MYLGMDIGGTKIAGALVSKQGEVQDRQESPTPIKDGGPAILEQSLKLADAVMSRAHGSVHAMGIGTGGQIDADQGSVFSATDVLPGYKGLRIKDAFEKRFDIPTRVDNDVNVLALGELRFGAARVYSKRGCVVFLALGTGVGGALLIDGKIHHGAHWTGGEFGHILMSIDPDARKDLGGAPGTLEAYCSGPALVQTYQDIVGAWHRHARSESAYRERRHVLGAQASFLGARTSRPPDELTGQEVVHRAINLADQNARRAIDLTGEFLGYGLVTLANALDPHLIVIGGGLSELGDQLLDPARRILRDRAMPGPAQCKIVTAQLGHDAALVGAASLVIP